MNHLSHWIISSQPRITAKAFYITSLITLLFIQPVLATTYTDATGELFAAYPNLDMVSVEITNDLSDITFIITVSEDPVTNDWGRYMIAIDSQAGGLTNFNAWYPKPISLSSGLEYWFGYWIDGGGGRELYHWREDLAAFDVVAYFGGYPIVSDNTVAISIPLSALGLSEGDTFLFDVFTSDDDTSHGAIDALSDPAETISSWSEHYSSTSELTYTVGQPLNMMIFKAVEIGWTSISGLTYQVQYSTNLVSTNWFNLGSTVVGNGSTNSVFDSARQNPQRYYRVIVE